MIPDKNGAKRRFPSILLHYPCRLLQRRCFKVILRGAWRRRGCCSQQTYVFRRKARAQRISLRLHCQRVSGGDGFRMVFHQAYWSMSNLIAYMCFRLPEQPLQRACDLYVDDTLIAWFFVAKAPSTDDIQRMTFEAGRNAVWTTAHDQRISTWHAAVLRAWQAGQRIAVVNSSTEEARIALAVKLRQLPSSDESPTRRIDVD